MSGRPCDTPELKKGSRADEGWGNLMSSMTTKRWSILVVDARGRGWRCLGCGEARTRRPDPSAEVELGGAPSLLHEVPAGDKLTLRFFRDPSAVPAVVMHDIDGKSLSSAEPAREGRPRELLGDVVPALPR